MRKIDPTIAKSETLLAFSEHFETEEDLELYCESISDEKERELFLYVGSIYCAFVKHGDWHTTFEGRQTVVDYFTHSYKLVSLFSLIESLSGEKQIDFYQWLSAKSRRAIFPINYCELETEYKNYKKLYGANRKALEFFNSLPSDQRKKLISGFTFGENETTIELIAKYLYNLRSQFVHNGQFILELGKGGHLDLDLEPSVTVWFDMRKLMDVFEVGVINHFSRENLKKV